jgi:hypothetical protein
MTCASNEGKGVGLDAGSSDADGDPGPGEPVAGAGGGGLAVAITAASSVPAWSGGGGSGSGRTEGALLGSTAATRGEDGSVDDAVVAGAGSDVPSGRGLGLGCAGTLAAGDAVDAATVPAADVAGVGSDAGLPQPATAIRPATTSTSPPSRRARISALPWTAARDG